MKDISEIDFLNYVKEHVKEIHMFSHYEFDQVEWAYLLLDDNSIIYSFQYKQPKLHFSMQFVNTPEKLFYRNLDYNYPELSIRDLGNNIIEHGFVEKGTIIIKVDDWNVTAW
jgi:hypothetical protein